MKRWQLHAAPQIYSFAFTLRVFTSTPTEKRVPVTAPDTVPADLYYNPANVLENSAYFGMSSRVLRDIVSLRFKADATREERQAAIDLVGGTVVGGQVMPGAESYYLVRVADDGTGRRLSGKIDTLNALAQVSTAQPEFLWLPEQVATSLRPDDAGDWTKPWQIDPTKADGQNRALETISAPAAWGCTTGSFATKVAVIDMGFFSEPDLTVNTDYAPALDAYTSWRYAGDDHGTTTASLVGARGNNQTGVTGTMWQVGLRLYDVTVADNGDVNYQKVKYWFVPTPYRTPAPVAKLLEYRLLQAIQSGASVINLSLGVPRSSAATVPPDRRAGEALRIATELANVVKAAANKPLLVIGAGNDGGNAYWGVLPILAKLVPDQAIVVGGIDRVNSDGTTTLWTGTNNNSPDDGVSDILVQIAAPAKEVSSLGDGGVTTHDGTSMAAPLVSGIAGLLKSFDPRLTARDIKDLLIAGSVRAGHFVGMQGTVFAADAYESLALAAERAGAPFCGGTPVWQDPNGLVFARRIVNGTAGPSEPLFTTAVAGALVPMHGETTIRADNAFYGWSNGSWLPYPVPRTDTYGNATNQSKLGRSHEGDSTVTFTRVEVNDTQETYRVFINGSLLAEVPSTWAKKPSADGCAEWDASMNCLSPISIWTDRVNSTAAVAYSPRGDEVVLAISKQTTTYRMVMPPEPCNAGHTCAEHGLELTTNNSELVFVGIADGQIRQRQAGPQRQITRLGYSEDGKRLVLQQHYAYAYTTYLGSEYYQSQTSYCDAQYNTRAGARLFLVPLKLNTANCYATATFSP